LQANHLLQTRIGLKSSPFFVFSAERRIIGAQIAEEVCSNTMAPAQLSMLAGAIE